MFLEKLKLSFALILYKCRSIRWGGGNRWWKHNHDDGIIIC